ncbi:MAG TPA: PQQ-binding-like beta-propeller repeat protein, partial [Pseudomonadaceae bacterium]|nr:PQQ-binding-like beta-propeller repeat protein [Pseudomonadaceae bacterium]
MDQERYINAASEPQNWVNYGNTWKEQRFSRLDQINDSNVDRLGLAWLDELGTLRGVVATPLVIDGVLYNISSWSVTTAYKADTGEKLWTYDPKVPPEYASITCCGVVSRGLAAWNGKIIVATLDGRLVALDAASGEPVWETNTLIDGQPLSITGAPRMADGLVVIGNSGGDVGARGYMTAYDAETGEKAWRFFIVPGEPGV